MLMNICIYSLFLCIYMCHELIILNIDLQSMSQTQLDLQSVCHELTYMCIYICICVLYTYMCIEVCTYMCI